VNDWILSSPGAIHRYQAQGFSGSTPYVKWANWPVVVFSFGVLGIAFLHRPMHKR